MYVCLGPQVVYNVLLIRVSSISLPFSIHIPSRNTTNSPSSRISPTLLSTHHLSLSLCLSLFSLPVPYLPLPLLPFPPHHYGGLRSDWWKGRKTDQYERSCLLPLFAFCHTLKVELDFAPTSFIWLSQSS